MPVTNLFTDIGLSGNTPQQGKTAGVSNLFDGYQRTAVQPQPAVVPQKAPPANTFDIGKLIQTAPLMKVAQTIKNVDFNQIKKAFVGGAKALPGMVQQAGGVILSGIIKQKQVSDAFFTPVKKTLGITAPKYSVDTKIENKLKDVASGMREAGFQSQKAATDAYGATKKQSKGFQSLMESVAFNLPQVVASTGLSVATAIITKNPALGAALGLSTSYGLGASEVYNTARSYGVPDSKANSIALGGGVVIGALDFLPLERLLRKTGAAETVKKSIIKKIASEIASLGVQAGWEGITEGAQQIVGNAISKTYNEHQDLMEGVTESVLVGAIMGAGGDVTVDGINKIVGLTGKKTSVEQQIQEAVNTPANERTQIQKDIVDAVFTTEMTPDEAMSFVLDNNLGTTEHGKQMVQTVVEAKNEQKNIQVVPSSDGKTIELSTVEPGQAVKASSIENVSTAGDVAKKRLEELKAKQKPKTGKPVTSLESVQTKPEAFQLSRKLEPLTETGSELYKVSQIVKTFDEKRMSGNPIDTITFPTDFTGTINGKQVSFKANTPYVTSGHNRLASLLQAKKEGKLTIPDSTFIKNVDIEATQEALDTVINESITTNIKNKSVKDINLLDLYINGRVNEDQMIQALAHDEKRIKQFKDIGDVFIDNDLQEFWNQSIGEKLSQYKNLDPAILQERLNFISRISSEMNKVLPSLTAEQQKVVKSKISEKISEVIAPSKRASLTGIESAIKKYFQTIATGGYTTQDLTNLFGETITEAKVQKSSAVNAMQKAIALELKSKYLPADVRTKLETLAAAIKDNPNLQALVNEKSGMTVNGSKTQAFIQDYLDKKITIPEKTTQEASKASLAESKVLPEDNISIIGPSEPLAGRVEPSGKTKEKTALPPGLPNVVKSTKKTLSSKRINFAASFNVSTPSDAIIADYLDQVKKEQPYFLNVTEDLARKNDGQYAWRIKTDYSLKKKLARRNKETPNSYFLGQIGDTLGSTIIVTQEKMDSVVADAKKTYGEDVVTKVDDFRVNPSFLGYKAVHMDVELPNGNMSEVQINTREGLERKEYAHERIYDKWRTFIEGNTKDATFEDVLASIPGEDKKNEFTEDVALSNLIFEGKVAIPKKYIDMVASTIQTPKTSEVVTQPQKTAELPVGQGKKKVSKFFERVKENLSAELQAKEITYEELSLDQQAQAVVDLIESDPKKAAQIANGYVQAPSGMTQNAVSLGLAEIALANNDMTTTADMWTKTSLRSTRLGQEIVSLRGAFSPDGPLNAVKQIISTRIDRVARQYNDIIKGLALPEGESNMKKVDALVKHEAKKLSVVLTKAQKSIASAQEIINKLKCK